MNGKKIAVIILLVLTALGFAACANDPVERDLTTYISESLPIIMDKDMVVAERYARISGEYFRDYEAMYDTLRDEIIPASLELIEVSQTILPKTEEIKEIHAEYISAINAQHSAFGLVLSALETQDYQIISSANEKLSEARAFMRHYLWDLNEIADGYNMEVATDGFSEPEDIYDGTGGLDPGDANFGDIPETLIFTYDGTKYIEPELGDFDAFVSAIFASYEEEYSEEDSSFMKLYGTGNDGYGYALNIILNLDPASENAESTDIISLEVVSLIVSPDPNSGGEEIAGQEMVQWVYENY